MEFIGLIGVFHEKIKMVDALFAALYIGGGDYIRNPDKERQ